MAGSAVSAAAFDGLLGAMLVWLAACAVRPGPLLRTVVLFVGFGLLMTLAWLRLRAPDLALAEAAVSTALTAVLVLDALGRLRRHTEPGQQEEDQDEDV